MGCQCRARPADPQTLDVRTAPGTTTSPHPPAALPPKPSASTQCRCMTSNSRKANIKDCDSCSPLVTPSVPAEKLGACSCVEAHTTVNCCHSD
ncbi:hypothetical protein IG631_10777 [Alternaria alternata]|nr:hypothetical protein IG631_10777 [Alternaria alternata]